MSNLFRDVSDSLVAAQAPKTGDLVARQIRRLIIRGELAEDDALPAEAELMEQFQVSRPTLREALRVLEAEGLITVRRGARGGARVKTPSAEVAARFAGLFLQYRGVSLRDVFEARTMVEPPAAAMLAEKRTKKQIETLSSLVKEAREAPTEISRMRCSGDFHRTMVRLAGNETLTLLATILGTILDEANLHFTAEDPNTPATQRRSHRAHEVLLEMIENKETEAAESLWRRHLRESGEVVLQSLPEKTVLELLA